MIGEKISPANVYCTTDSCLFVRQRVVLEVFGLKCINIFFQILQFLRPNREMG
jgi:hypothetical protein